MNASELRDWRARLGYTQEQAADALCVSPRHYQRLEAGHREVTDTVAKLASMLA